MKQTTKKVKARFKIVVATLTAIFSLFSAFTATMAWFASNDTVEATGASITVKAPDGVNFDLYYLHHFVIDQETNKDGNYNSIIDAYSGYQTAGTNAVFERVLLNESGQAIDENGDVVSEEENPTMISHLWPAHRLTYAIVVTSGDVTGFSLDSWDEETDENVRTTSDDLVSLSWAINIFGSAQFVTSTNSVTSDIAAGFTSYAAASLNDMFTYSEDSPAPAQHNAISILPSIGETQENKRTIIYFSIEFSDDSDTYYILDSISNGVSYYSKDTSGNSNCYESLSLKDLVFKLI